MGVFKVIKLMKFLDNLHLEKHNSATNFALILLKIKEKLFTLILKELLDQKD